ncbi:pyruvate kinase [Pectinatus cerevisiiphilus]|uniref:Pyruvate kinase n=1 Tax=Pectinatus cerevisiiphilus TaxID=86956 RepID=A0A4V2URY1_9FIRM|nr:pyruvate kinase [Pectinatus cerevisiiphilus]TCS79322.1 pyruvate kinase [Pectinatus cerevisiiphilus]
MLKKTKIICTMGPNVDKDPTILEDMIKNGMNVARFNFSHGDYAEHDKRINLVKQTARKLGKTISLVLDTKGPEMRLGEFAGGKVFLKKGNKFTITNDDKIGDETHVSVNHKNLYTEVKPGNILLLSDGLVALRVDEISGNNIVTTILNDGPMSTRKRVAAPGVSLGLPAVSEQDKNDIIFGIKHDMDFVAASFIQRADDVEEIRSLIEENNGHMEIIPKIECAEGVKNIDSIIAAANGIMVARGDLGVEIPAEDVPLIQKEIIKKCNKVGKPVIVATQMLETMTTNPRPTRAEASDVANAIFDGTDAIMLSGESANGDYPVEAVKVMDSISKRVESALEYKHIFINKGFTRHSTTTDVIAHATVQMSYELGAAAIIAPTESGYTAQIVSKYRPEATIIAYTPNEKVARHLNLRWGVIPIAGSDWDDVEEMITTASTAAIEKGIIKHGDKTIITSGVKFAEGNTSTIRIRTV